MYPQTHFLGALFLGEILVKLGWLNHKAAGVCAVLAMLIDLDHWFAFMIYYKRFNLREAWNKAAIKHVEVERTFIHHRTGFIILTIFILAMLFVNQAVFLVVGAAYYSHMFLDYVHTVGKKKYKFREFGFGWQITGFEMALDLVLVMGVVLLLI